MNLNKLQRAIIELVAEQLNVCSEKITKNSNFMKDLGADSLDVVEMLMAFEELADCQVSNEDADKMVTVKDLFDYCWKHNLYPRYEERIDSQDRQKISIENDIKWHNGVVMDSDGQLNSGHFHELIDRAHIICSMLDDYVIDHPGMNKQMNEKCVIAQTALSDMQTMASSLDEDIFGSWEKALEDLTKTLSKEQDIDKPLSCLNWIETKTGFPDECRTVLCEVEDEGLLVQVLLTMIGDLWVTDASTADVYSCEAHYVIHPSHIPIRWAYID